MQQCAILPNRVKTATTAYAAVWTSLESYEKKVPEQMQQCALLQNRVKATAGTFQQCALLQKGVKKEQMPEHMQQCALLQKGVKKKVLERMQQYALLQNRVKTAARAYASLCTCSELCIQL